MTLAPECRCPAEATSMPGAPGNHLIRLTDQGEKRNFMTKAETIATHRNFVELTYGTRYDPQDQTMYCAFSEGFFANCTVALWNVTDVARRFGHYPTRLDFSEGFSQYRQNSTDPLASQDLYPVFFQCNRSYLPPLNVSPPAINIDHHGIYQSNNFDYYVPLIKAYFSPSDRVTKLSNRLQDKYKIDLTKTVLVWYRGTDKRSEVWVASPQAYLKQVEAILDAHPDFKVWIQTEEQHVREQFREHFGARCIIIDELPPSSVGGNVYKLPPSEANIDRLDLAITMLALVTLGARAKFIVTHTGNIAFWICLYRGHTRSVLQFDRHGILFGLTDIKKYWWKLRRRLLRGGSMTKSRTT